MKLSEVIKATGLTKKTVYYYIEIGLINPIKNNSNGYYEFSENELIRISEIKRLKNIGLSLKRIQELYKYPSMTNYFLHRQQHIIKQSMVNLVNQYNQIKFLIEQLPPYALVGDIQEIEYLGDNNYHLIETLFYVDDSKMLAIMIWSPFLYIDVNSYRNYIWTKVKEELKTAQYCELAILNKLIYQCNTHAIMESSKYAFKVHKTIVNDPMSMVDDFLSKCMKTVDDMHYRNYWNLLKDSVIIPLLHFYISRTDGMMKEFNPEFTIFVKQAQLLVDEIYNMMVESGGINKIIDLTPLDLRVGINRLYLFVYLYLFDHSYLVTIPYNSIKTLL